MPLLPLPCQSISSIALPTTGAGSHRESLFSRLCRERLSRAALGDVSYIDEELDRRYRRHGVVLVSDMSGFTRTVKRRGILHFLTLIMQVRRAACGRGVCGAWCVVCFWTLLVLTCADVATSGEVAPRWLHKRNP